MPRMSLRARRIGTGVSVWLVAGVVVQQLVSGFDVVELLVKLILALLLAWGVAWAINRRERTQGR